MGLRSSCAWVLVLSCGCDPRPVARETAVLRLLDRDQPIEMADFEDLVSREVVYPVLGFDPRGIVALDGETAFLFGSLGAGPMFSRTFVLRTDDRGASWTELMERMPGSKVVEMAVCGDRVWVLVSFTVEEVEAPELWVSANRGLDWEHRGPLPGGRRAWLREVKLDGTRGGELVVEVDLEDEEQAVTEVLRVRSDDDGVSWALLEQHSEPGAVARHPLGELVRDESVAGDGSAWRLRVAEDAVHVEEQDPGDDSQRAAVLPTWFGHAQGRSFPLAHFP